MDIEKPNYWSVPWIILYPKDCPHIMLLIIVISCHADDAESTLLPISNDRRFNRRIIFKRSQSSDVAVFQ